MANKKADGLNCHFWCKLDVGIERHAITAFLLLSWLNRADSYTKLQLVVFAFS